MKKILALSFAVLAVNAAYGSFELMLAADIGKGVVHRLDPESGAYFGSFGAGRLVSPTSIAVSQTNGTAYVLDLIGSNAVIHSFNYNTGNYLGGFTVGALGYYDSLSLASDGTLLVARSGYAAQRYSTSGTLLSTYNLWTGNANYSAIMPSGDGNVLVTDAQNGYLFKFNLTGGSYTAWSSFATTSWQGCTQGSVTAVAGYGTQKLYLFNSTSTALTNTIDASGYFDSSGFFGVAAGHSPTLYGYGLKSSSTRIARYNTSLGLWQGTITNANFSSIAGVAVVLAPEPGTWAGLALGALILLRRRKR